VGGAGFAGCSLGLNGKIYFTPFNSTRVLQLDPNTNITALVGSGFVGSSKYNGSVLAPNGKIYFVPKLVPSSAIICKRVNSFNRWIMLS